MNPRDWLALNITNKWNNEEPATAQSKSAGQKSPNRTVSEKRVSSHVGEFRTYGSNVEVAMLTKWDRIRERRMREFFDELAETNLIDQPELLDCEDFLHRFFCTLKFATNTRQREKIQMFARLLDTSTVLDGELSDTDEFEDFAKILDELSYRELRALTILDRYTETPRRGDQNDLQWTETFWDEFCQQLSEELPIPFEESTEYMTRISRSGCYQEFVGYYDLQSGIGKLTPTYFRLKKYTLASSPT